MIDLTRAEVCAYVLENYPSIKSVEFCKIVNDRYVYLYLSNCATSEGTQLSNYLSGYFVRSLFYTEEDKRYLIAPKLEDRRFFKDANVIPKAAASFFSGMTEPIAEEIVNGPFGLVFKEVVQLRD